MAFPASPSNNDVHKEGNRAWVYDSTLGTWDQLRESDEVDTIGGGIHKVLTSEDTFPPGHVLQMQRETYHAQTHINGGPFKFLDMAVTARGTNSIWYGHWILHLGHYMDAEGWNLWATIGTGTPNRTDNNQIWSSSVSVDGNTYVYGNDLGGQTSAHATQYAFRTTCGDLSTDQENNAFAKGDTVRCCLWIRGNSSVYLNRSQSRSTAHEVGINSLTVWEIAQ